MSNFKINFGDPHEEFVLPTVEDCLRKYDASFYSAQNAVRIHEWLGDASAVSLLLTKVGTKEEVDIISPDRYLRLVDKYRLELGDYVFLSRNIMTRIMPLHQIAIAIPELVKHADVQDNTPEREKFIHENLRVMAVNTATAIFHSTHLPERLIYLNEDVLPLILAATITQRGRMGYRPKATAKAIRPDNKGVHKINLAFNQLHAMVTRNIFEDPAVTANILSPYFTMSEFRQIAMAASAVYGYLLPTPFYDDEETIVFSEAVTHFNQVKDELHSFKIPPQIRSHLRSVK